MVKSVTLNVHESRPEEFEPKLSKTWQDLEVGDTLELIDSEDMGYLQEEFAAQHKGEFEWESEECGPSNWVAHLRKIGPPPDSE